MWVYTEYGQRRAELFGNNNRKAGQPATCGKSPVTGRTAEAWEKSGYIVWKEDPCEDELKVESHDAKE